MFLFPWLYCLTIILAKPSASYPSPSYLLNPAPAVSNIIFAKTKQKLENMKQNYRIKNQTRSPHHSYGSPGATGGVCNPHPCLTFPTPAPFLSSSWKRLWRAPSMDPRISADSVSGGSPDGNRDQHYNRRGNEIHETGRNTSTDFDQNISNKNRKLEKGRSVGF